MSRQEQTGVRREAEQRESMKAEAKMGRISVSLNTRF